MDRGPNQYAFGEKNEMRGKEAEKRVGKITREGGNKRSGENILFLSLLMRQERLKKNKAKHSRD